MSFQELYGHTAVKRILTKDLLNNRISNAYVFCGVPGVGKRTGAALFARAMVCENKTDVPPCNNCSACKKAMSGNHPDIVVLNKPQDRASIGIEDVRETVLHEVSMRPYLAKRRVFIVADADRLTPEAQNALLKVMEEPPEYATFILCTTQREALLDTVLSRCVEVPFQPLAEEVICQYLQDCLPDSSSAALYAKLGHGSIGAALTFANDPDTLSQLNDSVNNLVCLTRGRGEIRKVADNFIGHKEQFDRFTDFSMTFLRDCVNMLCGLEESVIYATKKSEMRVMLQTLGKRTLISAFDRILTLKIRIKQNINFNAAVLGTVTQIWEDFHDQSSGNTV